MLESIFLAVAKMSATASLIAVVVILLRQMSIRKLPRIFSYAAWAIVLIRLLIPVSIQSGFSIFNIVESPAAAIDRAVNTAAVPWDGSTLIDIIDEDSKNITNHTGIMDAGFNEEGSDTIEKLQPQVPSRVDGSKNTHIHIEDTRSYVSKSPVSVISYLWLLVVLTLLGIGIYAYAGTSLKLRTAVLYDDNGLVEECSRIINLRRKIRIYTSDVVNTPVVAGLARVRIILPASCVQESGIMYLKHVITHELVHIKRFDYVTKLLAALALSIHWFNPLIWLCFLLAQKDMEMSCDEKVLSVYKNDVRSEYAMSLLNFAVKQNALLSGGLLAFGESDIKSRVKGIMRFKKSKAWLGIAAAVLLAAIGYILLTNGQSYNNANIKSAVSNDMNISSLLKHRNRYIGNASNISNLLDKLPYAENKKGIELSTKSRPYGITINYMIEDIEEPRENTLKNIETKLQDNALIIFSLIENVDIVRFNILPEYLEFRFERTEMQQYFDRELWDYSSSEEYFKEFLHDIYFKIYVYPDRYSPFMSSVPGLRIAVSLNSALYNAASTIKYSTLNGAILTWYTSNWEVTDHGRTFYAAPGDVVYLFSCDELTISVLNSYGGIIFEKHITIEHDDMSWVKPSYDIIAGSYYDPNRDTDYLASYGPSVIIPRDKPQEGSYISADIWINRSHYLEYISIDESLAAEIESRFNNTAKTSYDFNGGTLKNTGIEVILSDESIYKMCILQDGRKAFHKWNDIHEVLVVPEIFDMIAKLVEEKTQWEWIELTEIRDIVKAEMRMKLFRDSQEEVQIIEDRDTLEKLEKLFTGAKYIEYGGCMNNALLLLTREDGKTITLHIATDNCDTMILGTSAAYDYGPGVEQGRPGEYVNRKEILKRIFNQINWGE